MPCTKPGAAERPRSAASDQRGSSPAGASDFDVSVSEDELARYGADTTPEQLVTASFKFLLEREPSSSILRRFRLSQIEDYFPEYPTEIARQS